MGENDPIVNEWQRRLCDKSKAMFIVPDKTQLGTTWVDRYHWERGQLNGALRELAATIPGVREWLQENMP